MPPAPLPGSTSCPTVDALPTRSLSATGLGGLVLILAYTAVLVIAGSLSSGALLAAGLGLALVVEVLRRRALSDAHALLLAWAPVHLLVLGTGLLESPVLPLAAAWLAALGITWRRAAPWGALGATSLLLASAYLGGQPVAGAEVIRLLLLMGLAGLLPFLIEAPPAAAAHRRGGPVRGSALPDSAPEASLELPATAADRLLEVVRHATGADEAALWRLEPAAAQFEPVAWSGTAAATPAPLPVPENADHPYAWALAERQPIHLQKGRQPLPREFATEMLLVPVGAQRHLLGLAYLAPVPVHAGEAALASGHLLADLSALLPQPHAAHATSLDVLTGLADGQTFEARLSAAGAHFQRYSRPFGVVLLDIDHLERLNDRWGHPAGDRLLQHVAQLLRGALREVDLAARLGGEEFGLLLPEADLEQAMAVAERVRLAIESSPLVWNGRQLEATASFGVAACPDTCVVPTETRSEAEAALFSAKRGGRNRVSAASPRA